jgi:uncharacterized membrane protein
MKRTIVFLVLAALGVVQPAAGAEKSYAIESIRADARVAPDGSMQVTELISYRFDGRFSYAYRDVPLKRGEDLTEIGVRENDVVYRRTDTREPGTYTVAPGEDGPRITWYYDARDEARTFEFDYPVTGLVRRYSDTAEIYYQFVGEGWDREIARVDVEVRLPETAGAAGVRAWAHGPPHGTVSILPSGVVAFNISPLPPRTFWEGRILCDSGAFAGLAYTDAHPRLESILGEEKRWADEANRLREERSKRREAALRERERRAELGSGLFPIAIALGLGALGVWLMFFFRHGRPHEVAAHMAPGAIPSDHAPAAVSYLMYRTAGGPAVAATLLDLAARGYLEVRESVVTKKGLFGKTKRRVDYRFDVVAKSATDLLPFEQSLLSFVLTAAGDETGFSVLDLQKAASRNRSSFRKFFLSWNKQISEHCKSYGFFEPYAVGAMVTNALCGVGILGAGIAMSVLSTPLAGVPAIIGGGIQAVLTAALTRRTPEGRRLTIAWKAFKSHLKSLGRSMGPVTLGSRDWGRYLAVAVVFGIHKKLIPVLRLDEGNGVHPVWFYAAFGSGGDGGLSGLASGISSMVDTISTTASSAAGGGGGASGGGGGGSGGGGGGAG